MGTIYKYACNNCDYTVRSSADVDYGYMAVTEPHICFNCKEVIGVLIGAHGDVYSPYISNNEDFSKEQIDRFNKCDNCGGENIKLWSKYNRRCPKCNERMSQDKTAVKISKFGMKAMKYVEQHFSG